MAYPGEPEQAEYQNYVIETQSNGETPLPFETWRELKAKQQTMGQAIDTGLGYPDPNPTR